ncbi:Uncharacterised protein [Actinomyces bovis]|uniref:Uncharacterized protein n=1 Tax=Actinomyces bovis TaxID=1658 RepID=A0ABY1VP97_9ACTO|nr:Uncharacterised protein [Actinomyces bovis]VEG55667.1 Uncharacterised protein [Actinomyces israelii]
MCVLLKLVALTGSYPKAKLPHSHHYQAKQ